MYKELIDAAIGKQVNSKREARGPSCATPSAAVLSAGHRAVQSGAKLELQALAKVLEPGLQKRCRQISPKFVSLGLDYG